MILLYLYCEFHTEIVALVLCSNLLFASGLVDGNSHISGFDDEEQIT